MEKENERVAAFFGLLDKWDRAEGAVSVVNGELSIEMSEDMIDWMAWLRGRNKKGWGLWWTLGFNPLHLI